MASTKELNIEDYLLPNRNTLLQDEGDDFYHTTILDAELDPAQCSFLGDDCVEIDTKDVTYLTLSIENLKELIQLIKKAEKEYKSNGLL